MTDRQQLFAQTMVENGGNALQAAITAGYAQSYCLHHSHELAERRGIKKEIERLRASTRKEFNAEEALRLLNENRDAAKSFEDAGNMNRSVELMMKMSGLIEKPAKSVQNATQVNVYNSPEERLAAMSREVEL